MLWNVLHVAASLIQSSIAGFARGASLSLRAVKASRYLYVVKGDLMAEYGMVMPFVVVKSNGGTLDDESFVVGYELGCLEVELVYCERGANGIPATPGPRYVHTEGVKQLDLIAMRRGYGIETRQNEETAEWTWVEFKRQDDE